VNNIQYRKYVWENKNRPGIKPSYLHVGFYDNIVIASGSTMQKFNIDVLNFVRNLKANVIKYKEESIKNIKKHFPTANIVLNSNPPKDKDSIHIDDAINRYSPIDKTDVKIFKAYATYENYWLEITVRLKGLKKPANTVYMRDKESFHDPKNYWDRSKDTFEAPHLEHLDYYIREFIENQIKYWTTEIEKDVSMAGKCPDHILNRISNKLVKLKGIGLFED
jgi:hypothetical protein